MPKQLDSSILQMALIGYQRSLENIETKISELQNRLGGRAAKPAASETTDGGKPRRKMSGAARKRIADAQKKRWKEFHAKAEKSAPVAEKAPAKRKLSPARKAALVANLKKARAAKAAKRNAGEATPF